MIKSFMNNSFQDIGLLILRLFFGLSMLSHGYPKFLKLVGGDLSFADPFGIGQGPSLILTVIAEFLCALMIIVGYKTKWAAIPLMITMLTAILLIHGSDPYGDKELAVLYFGAYLCLFLMGSGKYSLEK